MHVFFFATLLKYVMAGYVPKSPFFPPRVLPFNLVPCSTAERTTFEKNMELVRQIHENINWAKDIQVLHGRFEACIGAVAFPEDSIGADSEDGHESADEDPASDSGCAASSAPCSESCSARIQLVSIKEELPDDDIHDEEDPLIASCSDSGTAAGSAASSAPCSDSGSARIRLVSINEEPRGDRIGESAKRKWSDSHEDRPQIKEEIDDQENPLNNPVWPPSVLEVLRQQDCLYYLDLRNARERYGWMEIPLVGMRKATPSKGVAPRFRRAYYGVNDLRQVPPILKDGYLKPSTHPRRNAGGGKPKIWAGTYSRSEPYACPHVHSRNYIQVQFRVNMLHAKQKSCNEQRTEFVWKTRFTESVELTHLRVRCSGPPQKYHLHQRSPIEPQPLEPVTVMRWP